MRDFFPGLAGVPAAKSKISSVDGNQGILEYRGIPIEELAEEGVGILLISSDLPELLGLSDRVLVVHQGHLAGEFTRQEATPEKVIACAFTGGVS